jgi:hypothetical protein
MLKGYIDRIERDLIAGWAADADNPEMRVELAIAVDGAEVGRVIADRHRSDLARLGKYGDGRHGFEFRFASPLPAASEHDVVIRSVADAGTLGKFKFCRRSDSPVEQRSSARRYVIHIGQPKTGTKYLQHFFHGFHSQMLQQGILYPMEWWAPSAIFNHNELHRELNCIPNAKLEDVFRHINDASSRIVLLSCEGFCDLPSESLQYLRYLIAGSDADIIYYTRRWSDIIRSTWQQNVKEGSSETFPAFYARLLAEAGASQLVNQKIVLDRFAEVFGHDSLHIMSYSNMEDHGQDIAADFFHRILGWNGDLILDQSLVHESMDMPLTELVRCLNALEIEHKGSSDFRVFTALEALAGGPEVQDDIDLAFAAMRRYQAEIIIDDNAYALRAVFDGMQESYADRLMNKEFGETFFERKKKLIRYVNPDFLLADGAAAAIRRIHASVVRQSETG